VLSVSASTRAFGSAKSDPVAQRVKTCSLSFASILRFNSSLRFAAISARSSSMLPLAMPNAFGELGVDSGMCGASTRFTVKHEIGVPSRDLRAVIVGGNVSENDFGFPRAHSGDARSRTPAACVLRR
jgi:hypothetical protein